MPDGRDTQVPKIVCRQIGQKARVNVILPECRLVLLKSQLPQEIADIHGHTSTADRLTEWASPPQCVQLTAVRSAMRSRRLWALLVGRADATSRKRAIGWRGAGFFFFSL